MIVSKEPPSETILSKDSYLSLLDSNESYNPWFSDNCENIVFPQKCYLDQRFCWRVCVIYILTTFWINCPIFCCCRIIHFNTLSLKAVSRWDWIGYYSEHYLWNHYDGVTVGVVTAHVHCGILFRSGRVAPLSENCLGGGAWLHIEMLGSLNRFGLDEIGPYIPRYHYKY